MLIYLDDSIKHSIENNNLNNAALESLEDLASVIRAGTHLIIGGYETLNALSNLNSLGTAARTAYKALTNKFSQLNSALNHVTTYAKISTLTTITTTETQDKKRIITIPLSSIRQMNLKSPVEIIFEELNDSSIYEIISRWYLKEHITPGFINRDYRAIHGGGGRTHVVYTDAQNRNNQFCLCITDSDKKFPTDIFGQTSTDVRAADQPNKVLSYHLDLDFHEIENLVPLTFLKKTCKTKPSQDLANLIKSTETNGTPEAKLFWDYKKGFKLSTLKAKGGWQYWKTAFNLTEMTCATACESNTCTCEILKPWPEKKAIKDEIEKLSEMDPSECEILKNLWYEIGNTLISWSISAVPKTA